MVCIKCLTQGLAHGMYSTNVNYHEYHYEPQPLTVWITTNWKILKETGIPDHLTCLLRNLYAGQEATVRRTWNNKLVPNWGRSTSRLYIVTLLI